MQWHVTDPTLFGSPVRQNRYELNILIRLIAPDDVPEIINTATIRQVFNFLGCVAGPSLDRLNAMYTYNTA